MITMEILGWIRRMHLRDGLGYSEIARRTGLSRNTIKRWLKGATAGVVRAPRYRRRAVARKLAKYIEQIERALVADSTRIKRDRRTGKLIFAEIKAAGYTGGYSFGILKRSICQMISAKSSGSESWGVAAPGVDGREAHRLRRT